MKKIRTLLSLEAEAHGLLERATTPRKKGEYLSELIKRAVPIDVDESAPTLERIEQRLIRVEALLEQLARKDITKS